MRALVTGGNRYIGLDLVFELARRGHEVTVVNSHEAPLPEGARRIHCDRTQPGALAQALGPHRDDFDVVFDHTAYRPADIVTFRNGKKAEITNTDAEGRVILADAIARAAEDAPDALLETYRQALGMA